MPDSPLTRIRHGTTEVLSDLLRPGEPVALLDFPLYVNPGDALIYLGTLEYLDELGVPVRHTTDLRRYSPERLAELHPSGPILLQGGGNFGDRYLHHQEFRERVMAEFPDRRIIQLPQTSDMSHQSAEQIHRQYRQHSGLTVLLRDTRSMRFAEEHLGGLDVRYCPDLAFGYSPKHSTSPDSDVFELKRVDDESTAVTLFSPANGVTVRSAGWRLSCAERAKWSAPQSRLPKLGSRAIPALADAPAYRKSARLLVRSAQRMISQGRIVVTDRLHGAVLSALIGRPVVARDNANRKLSAIIDDYLERVSYIHARQAWRTAAAR